jgi:DNA polymerase-3 subunit alpha
LNLVDEYFKFKCWRGFEKRGLVGKKEYEDRLKFELDTICKMGFAGYFLIVSDFINWARNRDIPVGPGRGSVGGALIAYCLEITQLDPIEYGLLFERFMNPDRVSMPDIDVDFCEHRRDEVIQYVTEKYGQDKVAQIGTFGTMKAKGAIRDVARTLGVPLSIADNLAKLIPPPVHGKPVPLAKAIEQVPQLNAYSKAVGSPESEILKWALKLENTIRSYGIHASGVVISPVSLNQLLPLAVGKDGNQATQLEMGAVEKVGLIKFDFLGLRTLTMLKLCCDLVKKHHGITVNLDDIPRDDHKTFEQLRQGDNCGIFQLETSSGIRDLLIKMIPRQLEDLIALVAMYRPGPLGSSGMQMYLDVRAGRRDPEYPFKELTDILKPTAGWIIYQEQCMQIARTLAGYSRGLADDLRKAIGKKKEKDMEKHESIFVEGAVKNGFDKSKAMALYKNMKDFGAYGFNKAHAAEYGLITYQTAYMKTHYPVEFMCAALTCDYSNTAKVIKYISECRRMGIQILPPDVNQSHSHFTISIPSRKSPDCLGAIRFGLSAIKNLGDEPVSYIVNGRGAGFRDLIDFCERVDLSKINRKKLESLVSSGAFDSTGYGRTTLLATIDKVWEYREDQKRHASKTETFFKKIEACKKRDEEILAAELAGKKKPNKLKVPEKPIAPKPPEIIRIPEMDDSDMLAQEKELLGFYISGHPLDAYSSAIDTGDTVSIDDLSDMKHDTKVSIPGIVSSLSEKQTKKGDTMAFGVIEDKTGQVDMVIFASTYVKCKELLAQGKPLMFKGKVELTSVGGEEDIEDAVVVPKVVVFNVLPLVSGEIKQEPIDIRINPEQSSALIDLLTKYPGNNCQVHIYLKTMDDSLFKIPMIYSIGGSKQTFLRDLGRIII